MHSSCNETLPDPITQRLVHKEDAIVLRELRNSTTMVIGG